MKKHNENRYFHNLMPGAVGAQFAVGSIVFITGLLAVNSSYEANKPDIVIIEKARPAELVKIYSIVKSHRPDIDDTEAWKVSGVIHEESLRHGLDPMLVLALIQVESGFRYQAVSPMGARGIMQIMPEVAEALAQEIGVRQDPKSTTFQPEHLDDPVFNIKLGVYYLYDLKKSFRNLNLALSAYNVGPTKVRNRLENNIELPEHYAAAVLGAYERYKAANHPMF